jgi:lipopolysaccharide transport system permease protein
LGLGSGLIVTALTTKYRDLKFVATFAIDLLRYVSPVVFALSSVEGMFKTVILLNPMSAVIETFRYICFQSGSFEGVYLLYSLGSSILILALGTLVFSYIEKDFIDTV